MKTPKFKAPKFQFSQLDDTREGLRKAANDILTQPTWIWGGAAVAALLVILGPILWLLLQACLTFLVVFLMLMGARHALRWWLDHLRSRERPSPQPMYRSGTYTVEILSGRDG